MDIAGALRLPAVSPREVVVGKLVYMALPFDEEIAWQMVEAAYLIASVGFEVFARDHPMTPYKFEETHNIHRTQKPFHQFADLSALIYSATTVGLEAVIAVIPTICFRPKGKLSLDILPPGVEVPVAQLEDIVDGLGSVAPVSVDRTQIFANVLEESWRN